MFGSNPSPVRRRFSLLTLLLLLPAVSAVFARADREILDPAPSAWNPGPDSAIPQPVKDGLRFDCPFPSGVDRHVWDAPVDKKRLAGFHGLEFVYAFEKPEAFRGLSWYAQSGPGWYVTPLPPGDGLRRVWIPFSQFEKDGLPSAWKDVRTFRLSPWPAGRGGGALTLYSIRARASTVAILRPGASSLPDPGERAFGQRSAHRWAADLHDIGLPPHMINEEDFSADDLDGMTLLVMPYNPNPPAAVLRAVKNFIKKGGKILVCYNAHEEYAALVGVAPQRWTNALLPGQFHKLSFTGAPDWNGPDYVLQPDTPHLLPVTPRAKDARLIAAWADAAGNTNRPAIVVSPRGAWFSYLLGNDDDAARRRMIAFLVDSFMPGAALQAARTRLDILQLESRFAGKRVDTAPVEAALKSRDAAIAWDAVERVAEAFRLAGSDTLTLPPDFPVGIWDHSGLGLHGGDWPRTAAELADARFTDVFVCTRRNGPVPLAATAALRERGLRAHAWHICFNLEGLPAAELRALESAGRLQKSAAGATVNWLCPSLPENRRAEVDRLLELAATPGVAGVHLDYIRYPDEAACYCRNCRDGFEKASGQSVGKWPDDVRDGDAKASFLDWRAEQVSLTVREVAEAVRAKFPELKISAAVWPDAKTVKTRIGQNWPRWLPEGWIDFVAPMSYTDSAGEFAAWTVEHTALPGAAGKVWAGIGVTSSQSRLPVAAVLRQIQAAMEAGASGVVIFDLNATVRTELFPVIKALRTN